LKALPGVTILNVVLLADLLVAVVMTVASDAVDVACEQNQKITHAVNINLLYYHLLLLLFHYQRRIKNSVGLGLRIGVWGRAREKCPFPFPIWERSGEGAVALLRNVFRS